jgi:hypothetical protein
MVDLARPLKTGKAMKSQDEMWVEVLEWMGTHVYVPFDNDVPRPVCKCGKPPSEHHRRPPLTLDVLHEAEKKLTEQQATDYSDLILHRVDGVEETRWLFDAVHATAEQRLLALWRTIAKGERTE